MNLDDLHLDRIGNVSLTGWAIVGGAAAVGEFAMKSTLAALALGAGALWWVLQGTPCCSGCAQGAGCGGAAPSTKASADASGAMAAAQAVAGAFTVGAYGTGGADGSSGSVSSGGGCCGGAGASSAPLLGTAPVFGTAPTSYGTRLAAPAFTPTLATSSAGMLRL